MRTILLPVIGLAACVASPPRSISNVSDAPIAFDSPVRAAVVLGGWRLRVDLEACFHSVESSFVIYLHDDAAPITSTALFDVATGRLRGAPSHRRRSWARLSPTTAYVTVHDRSAAWAAELRDDGIVTYAYVAWWGIGDSGRHCATADAAIVAERVRLETFSSDVE